jgi:uncharacterized protein YggE
LPWALAAAATLLVGPGGAQQPAPGPGERVIAVTGVGRVLVAPDQAVVSLGATVQREEAKDAQRELDAVMQKTLSSIRALGIAAEKLQTAGLSLLPVYAEPALVEGAGEAARRRDEPRIVAYRATNVVQVTVDDLALVGAVVDASIAAGSNEIRDISFGLADDLPYRVTALERAVEAAQRKASAAAGALGVGLGEPVELRERSSAVPFGEVTFARAAGAPIEAGELAVEVVVDATFRLGTSSARN